MKSLRLTNWLIIFGSLGTAVAGTLEARTCSGSSHRIPNELGSPELKPREFPKTLIFLVISVLLVAQTPAEAGRPKVIGDQWRTGAPSKETLADHALWTKAIGDQTYLEECYSVQKTDDNGYILAGRRSLSTQGAKSKVFLVKTNFNGDVQWSKEIDPGFNDHSRGLSVLQADDGGYVIAGWAETPTKGTQGYLIKTNSTGTVQWDYVYGGDDDDSFESVSKTSDGGYILAGHTVSYAHLGYSDAWLMKVNSDGQVIWDTVHGGTGNEWAYEVIQTTDGGYIFSGSTSSEETFDIDDEAVFIVKTDNSGYPQWFKTFDLSTYGSEEAESIEQTADNGYIIGGWYEAGSDPGVPFLIKTSSSGDEQWRHFYNLASNDVFSSVDIADDGGYIAAGRTNSTGNGSYDALVIKTDASGNEEWCDVYGGSDYDAAYSIQQTGDGGYIIGGKAVGLQWAGGTDMYLIRIYDHFVYLPLISNYRQGAVGAEHQTQRRGAETPRKSSIR